MRALLLMSMLMACQQHGEAKPPARRGVEPRTEPLKSEPARGVMLESFGLVNETFRIVADLDAKEIVRVTRFAKDGSERKTTTSLSEAEVKELLQLREKCWAEWTEPKRDRAAEYQEHLYLLDGDATTHIRAEGGFRNEGVAGVLAHRLQALAKKR